MELGDRVIYYTHEASDTNHRTVDRLAFVLGIVDEDTIDIAVLPPGGPIEFHRVWRYNPELPVAQVGLSYWRPVDEGPPDFAEFRHHNDPRWVELRRKQWIEWKAASIEDHEALRAKNKQEQNDLDARLDKEQSDKTKEKK